MFSNSPHQLLTQLGRWIFNVSIGSKDSISNLRCSSSKLIIHWFLNYDSKLTEIGSASCKTIFSRKATKKTPENNIHECFKKIKKLHILLPFLLFLLLSFLYTFSFTNQKDRKVIFVFILASPVQSNTTKSILYWLELLLKRKKKSLCMVFLYLIPLCFYNWETYNHKVKEIYKRKKRCKIDFLKNKQRHEKTLKILDHKSLISCYW